MRLKAGSYWVRSLREDDLEALVRYADNPRVAYYLRDQFPQPYTESDGREWLGREEEEQDLRFAIADDRELIGCISILLGQDVYRHTGELGYWLGEPFWGRGIVAEAIDALVSFTFATLDLQRIFARTFDANKGSERALQKAGFTLEARLRDGLCKHGRFFDELVYVRMRGDN